MQGLEGGRGPPADFGRNRTRREETSNGTFDRRAGDIYNERGHTYDRTHFPQHDYISARFAARSAEVPKNPISLPIAVKQYICAFLTFLYLATV